MNLKPASAKSADARPETATESAIPLRGVSDRAPGLRELRDRELQDLCINTIRMLSADAVQNANAGHPGHRKSLD